MKEIDGVLKDWGERASYGTVKGRKGRNVAGGRYSKPAPTKKPAGREKLEATLKKAPEVMVKISGGGKDMRGIKAHLDYISRNGDVDLEDEQGRVHQGKEDVRDVRDDWKGNGIPYESGNRREAFNIVLSMPPGTDRASVKDAARAFAAEMFDNHQYVFAAHDDEKHPHVHLAVKAMDKDGIRLNPRKADLQHWRESFADKLREQGIEANATPRRARGVVQKAEKQAVRHINRDYSKGKRKEPAKVTAEAKTLAQREAAGEGRHSNPAQVAIGAARKRTQKEYGTVARALAAGTADDKQLALDVVEFIKQLPPITTQHAERVRALKDSERTKTQEVSREQQQGQGKERSTGGKDKGQGDLSR